MAKQQNSFARSGCLSIQYLPKERHFVCWRPHVSMQCSTRKDVLKFARWPASTPTGQALREWLDEVLNVTQPPEVSQTEREAVKATGFGPEHHDPADHDPTANTRMVV